MKKILAVLVLLLVGCSNHAYVDFVAEAQKEASSENIPFHIEIYIDDSEANIIYQAIIDQPTTEGKNIQAMILHDQKSTNIFPSIGVVDEPFTFSDTAKGINLIGYVEKKEHIQFRVYIKMNNQSYTYLYDYNSTS